MALNRTAKIVLKALTSDEFDLERSRRLVNLRAINLRKPFHKMIDTTVDNNGYPVPIRIYVPKLNARATVDLSENELPVIIYTHGGGFVSESVDTYNSVCWNLSNHTNHIVVSIDYRLAPEHRFPIGLLDCYEATKAIFENRTILKVDQEKITVMGDSAGGNLTTVVCQMARDQGDFMPKRQILLYPCTDNDYSEDSKYPSVVALGNDYLLTREDMHEYMEFYKCSEDDFMNPYFSPMKAEELSNMPKTLLLTAQYDPLRDEGEAYAKKLRKFGNEVISHQINDVTHAFFQFPKSTTYVREALEYIDRFLDEVREDVSI